MKKLTAITLFGFATATFALQGGPTQPDYLQFEPSNMPDMVSLQTGDFSYSLPLGDVPGPYGNYPLSLSYHAGITPNQEATWVGLGWTLNAGVINRDVRGVPDDQFHGGTLSFIYQYSGMQVWNVNLGWSVGLFSVGLNTSNQGGTGYTATVGTQIAGFVNVGFTVGTDAFGLSAGVGNDYAGVNASLMFSTKDRKPIIGVGGTLGNSLYASAGVQYMPGQKVSSNVGFGVSAVSENPQNGYKEQTRVGLTMSSHGMSVSGSQTLYNDQGKVIATNPAEMSVTNSHDRDGNTKTSTTAFGIIIPTYVGVFSFGYSQSIYEYHLRSATSDNVYGYMYQAGPAIVADDENVIGYLPEAMEKYRGSSGEIPWNWTEKGRTLETVGKDHLSPAYDMYSVFSEGVSGTFRPFARENHHIHRFYSDENSAEKTVEDYTPILMDSANGFAYVNEFVEGSSGLEDNDYDYSYCLKSKGCSPYALYKTRFRNGGNRLVYRKDKDSRDTIHSGIEFLFAGDAGGYFESDKSDKIKKLGRKDVASTLLSKKIDDYQYALLGSRKVEPILDEDSPVGHLKGFVITKSDGSKYYFTKPVKSYLKIDYVMTSEKGVPVFVEKSYEDDENKFLAVLKSIGSFFVERMESYFTNIFKYSIFGLPSLLSGESVENKCKGIDEDSKAEDNEFFSYSINMNPYATQWLLTEIQGPDFVKLGNSIEDNIGYNVKFTYTDPQIYRWRTPYARPGLNPKDLPNSRIPKNGLTPEGCDTRMFQAAMGVKEYIYLKSIETSTHKAEFILNDPETEERIDGKGFDPLYTEKNKENEIPIFVHASLGLNLKSKGPGSEFVNKVYRTVHTGHHQHTVVDQYKGIKYQYEASDGWLYVNSEVPDALLQSLKKSGEIPILGFDDKIKEDAYRGTADSVIYGLLTNYNLKVAGDDPLIEKTTGAETKNGMYKIKVSLGGKYSVSQILKDRNDEEFGKNRTLLLGENGHIKQNPYINWGDIVWNVDETNSAENQMRYLKRIEFSQKNQKKAYKKVVFDYDYSLQPKTLNSYCQNKYPQSNQDLIDSPDSVGIDACSINSEKSYLYGKLTLKSITESGCRYNKCVDLPPFRFGYNSPSQTSTRISSKDGWISLARGMTTNQDDFKPMYPNNYYESITDVDASIIATENSVDEWGVWDYYATPENHKTNQNLADYNGAAWSLNKVVDPAGGVMEVVYERDVYGQGENYGDDYKYVPIVGFGDCENYKDDYNGLDSRNDGKLCIEIKKLYWREQCIGPKAAYWDENKPIGYQGDGFEYLESLGIKAGESKNVFLNLSSDVHTRVDCGILSTCSRDRNAAIIADAKVNDVLKGSSKSTTERMLLVTARDYDVIKNGFVYAATRINPDYNWRYDNSSHMGFMWVADSMERIKGGDVRVSKLKRYDIDRVSETSYGYGIGELAMLPDSVLNTVMANRFYTSKATHMLPDLAIKPKSRIVGFNDDDLDFVPGSKITYPVVNVKNTKGDTNQVNGRTEFKYVTPETGIPMEYVDSETAKLLKPFLKINAQLMYWGEKSTDNTFRAYKACYELLDESGKTLDRKKCIPMLGDQNHSVYFYDDNIKKTSTLKVSVSMNQESDGTFSASMNLKDSLGNFNELSISNDMQFGDGYLKLNKKWLRKQRDGYYPILYKSVVYAPVNFTLQNIGSSDIDEEKYALDLERDVTYHDLTAFLGLNYKTTFYRGNRNEIAIKIDSTVYSTAPSDVLDGFADNSSSDVQKKLGRQKEHWNVTSRLSCTEKQKGKDGVCEQNYPLLYENDLKKDSTYVTYIRYPAFLIKSISMTGYDGADTLNAVAKQSKVEIENHAFDPIMGAPTASLAKIAAPGEMEKRKLTQSVPYYYYAGKKKGDEQIEIPKEMFLRNMFSQSYLNTVYTKTVKPGEKWNSIAKDQNLRSFSISPFGYLPDSVKKLNRKPIIAFGEFKPKQDPSLLYSESLDFLDGNGLLPSLKKYSGKYITKVDSNLRIREVKDALDKTLSTIFSSDGINNVSLFYPATMEEVAVLLPYQDTIVTQNCVVDKENPQVNSSQGWIVGKITINCKLKDGGKYIVEYRQQTNSGWKSHRKELDGNQFNMTLKSNEKLNYLRIYPITAEAKTFIYDNYGMMIQLVSEDNLSSYYVYNAFGNLVEVYNDDGVSFKSHHREFMNDEKNNVEVKDDSVN